MSNIQVVVRCRSRNQREVDARSPIVVEIPNDRCSIDDPYITVNYNHITTTNTNTSSSTGSSSPLLSNQRTYKVDQVYGSQADQSLVFKNVALPLFNEFFNGFNVTILAYGQTGTGKTFTMCGNEPDIDKLEECDENIGIIPRVLHELFSKLKDSDCDYVVKCSYLELYNEDLKDLLQEDARPLKIYEQNGKSGKSIKIQNLCERQITDYKQGFKYLKMGLDKRKTAATKLNDVSSRSHTIFTINLYKNHGEQDLSGDSRYHIAKMNLVDLAGSENVNRSGSIVKETGSINQSLLTLGRVINTLSEQKPNQHIPYRESKLTRLLQDSIGGNTKTTLIATISPAKVNIDETCSTLDYASKAKNIKNIPQIGHESDSIMKKTLVKNLSVEIVRLNSDLVATRSKNGIYLDPENYQDLVQENESLKTSLKESQLANESIRFKLQEVKESSKVEIDKIKSRMNKLDGKNKQLSTDNHALLSETQKMSIENEQLRQKLNRVSVQMTHSSDKLSKVLFENLNSSITTIKDTITKDSQKHNIDDLIQAQLQLTSQLEKYNHDIDLKVKASNDKVRSLVNDGLSNILDNYRLLSDKISTNQREYIISLQQQISQLKQSNEQLATYLSTDRLALLSNNLSEQITGITESVFTEFKNTIIKSIDDNKNKLCNSQLQAVRGNVDKESQILQQHMMSWRQELSNIFPSIEKEVGAHDQNVQSSMKSAANFGKQGQERINELLHESNTFSLSDIPQPDITKLETISKNLSTDHDKLVEDLTHVKNNLGEIELFDAKNAFKISPIKIAQSTASPDKKQSTPSRRSPPAQVSRIARASTIVGSVRNRDDTKIPKLNRSKSFDDKENRNVKRRKILQLIDNQ
ncbi:uncharacterized protein SPAPADRAFT_70205 [Spathaspora passalidarum NRRL Y-27907]|uniref:Kinesin-like protein n=1 Tax=Spathaspora passalidarum (strain NRRL Y-27907 / 11-Y1) TaxID=619300 RepID=G3AJT4_SPAPN|nr:uncharacterized protein SPAPADRAFT_70205 [Spathaspora passalidarum NRRL Y-27907]EGW33985.1 hypothetical protein SPAPADRAFT_70205 [Spathaspora passalidarum NRRL Y-27907]